ncbi:TPA: hypothetical protein QDZ75_002923 [Stenotrophomonas maltophilia]|jgi:hypothetical protein|uniref:hypothetical protein n=1 Tax=Stenotrophomonas maltophilia TaxID=40324 RepID=UPI002A923BE5|nr:hypothetical protein [Stenotrophomonas maltophilia]HEL5402789.1 hypothetical protein [Stenotrophomonas maltophilia]
MDRSRNKDFVDVDRELAHWETAFKAGSLPAINFRHEVAPVVRLACDIYVRDQHGSQLAWLQVLKQRLAMRSSLRGNPGAEVIATGCWALLAQH